MSLFADYYKHYRLFQEKNSLFISENIPKTVGISKSYKNFIVIQIGKLSKSTVGICRYNK